MSVRSWVVVGVVLAVLGALGVAVAVADDSDWPLGPKGGQR